MTYRYETKGTCSKAIELDIENGIVNDVRFVGGCNGNLQGIGALVKGMPAEDVARKLQGINCGMKGTSCPDQLAKALRSLADQSSK